MALTEVGQIADAVGQIAGIINGVLTREDRDKPDKEKNENVIKLQNAFLADDVDHTELGVLVQLLLAKAGHPASPSRDPGIYRREIFHALILCTIDLIHERELNARAFAKLVK